MLEANVVKYAFGGSPAAAAFFMVVAVILLFGTQLSLVEGVSRQLADTLFISSERVRRLFKNDIRTAYFWVITLFTIWTVVWISMIYIGGIKHILLVQLPANVNLVYQVVSALLTVYFIYGVVGKSVPKEIWEAMKPHQIVPVLLILGSLYWLYFARMGWAERFGLLAPKC